jgi:hypothetical protein
VTGLDLRHAETDAEVAACFPVMTLLRPHLTGADERVARQRKAGYRILGAWREDAAVALAGYRTEENLQIRDVDDIIAETAPLIEAHNLDLDTVRDALLAEFAPARAGAPPVPH